METTLHIREYQAADYDVVWQLHILSLQSVGAYAGNGSWDNDLHSIEEVYLNNRGAFLVGECEGRIVAIGALRRTNEKRAEIKRMRVHPDFQEHGFGKMILQALEAKALVLGYSVLHLDTSTVQTAAQSLYRKNGYKETGETREHRGFIDIFFEKCISSV